MKVCPLCKTEFTDDATSCPACKALLIERKKESEASPEIKQQRAKDWRFLMIAIPGFVLFIFLLYWLIGKLL